MAEIKLAVRLNTDPAQKSMGELSKYIKQAIEQLNKVSVDKDLTDQIKAVTEYYKEYAKVVKAVSKEETEAAKKRKIETQSALNEEKTRTEQAKQRIAAEKEANRHLEQTTKEENRHQEQLEKNSIAQEKVAASINKTTEAYKKHSFTIGDTIERYAKFAVASMLIYEPLRKIIGLLGDIDDTLVKTEDTIIALQRILPAGSGTNEKLADDLYALAQEYGQTFDNVQQIATNFARTGMDWTETLDATRAALLALNVAELDSAQASDGLIAVMSQFKIDAKDLTGVIDMLNKTADNFPVTTEKLLYALQRTGSAAVNANISLEDTIGIITSLSEATGRSGQNLGTAVNALIQYSSKADALEIFAKLDENSAKAVENFRMGAGSILDVWKAVSDVINNANAQQQQALNDLANMDEVQSLASDLHDELGDIFEQTQEVYGTANTFRKNYFISLLANIDTVMNASKVASDSAGYSQKENAQYLETYTAKANELKSLWEDIANDEQGILGFKKGMADLGVSILTVIKNTGGLKTALVPVSTLMTAMFSKKIVSGALTLSDNVGKLGKNFTGLLHPIKTVTAAIEAHRAAQAADALQAEVLGNAQATQAEKTAAATAAAEAHETAMAAEAAAAGVLNIAMLAVTAALVIGMTAYSNHIKALEDAAEKSAEVAKKSKEEADALQELSAKIDDGKTSSDDLRDAFYQQLLAMGKTREEIDALIESYGGLTDAMRGVTKEQAAQARRDAAAALYAEFDSVKGEARQGYGGTGWASDNVLNRLFGYAVSESTRDEYSELRKAAYGLFSGDKLRGISVKSFDTVNDEIEAVIRYKNALEDFIESYKELDDEAAFQESVYKNAVKYYNDLMNEIGGLSDAYNNLQKAQQDEATALFADLTYGVLPKTTLELSDFRDKVEALEDTTPEVKAALIDMARNGLWVTAQAANDTKKAVEGVTNAEKQLAEIDFAKATDDEIISLLKMAAEAGLSDEALKSLIITEGLFNGAELSVDDKIAALKALGDEAAVTDVILKDMLATLGTLNASTSEGGIRDLGAEYAERKAKAKDLREWLSKYGKSGSSSGGTKSQKTPADLAREAANAKITEADSAYNLAQVDGTDFAGQVAALNAKADAQMAYVELLKSQNATQTDINNAVAAYYQTKKQINDLETKEAERKDKEYKDTIKSVGDQFAAEINSLKTVYTLREKEGATLEEKNAILEQEIGVYDRDIAYYEQFVGYEDTINKLKTERLTIEEQIRKNIEADQKARIEAFDDELSALKTEYTLREHQGANERELIGNLRKQQDKLHGKAEYYREIGKSQEEINKLSNEWWEIEEKIEAVIKSVVDEHRKLFEEEFDKYQKAREDFLQAQIDSLKRTKELNSETLGIEEKRLAVMEAQKKLLDAMANRTVRVYNAETGRFEWQANEAAIAEARSGLKSARQAQADAKLDARIAAAERSKANAVSYMEGDRVREMAKFEGNAYRYGDALRGTLKTGNAVAGNTTKNEDNSTNYFIGNISMKKQLEPDMTLAEAMNLMRISGKND